MKSYKQQYANSWEVKMSLWGKLLPRSTNFFDFFEAHVDITLEAAGELIAMIPLPHDKQTHFVKKIALLEKKADAVTHDCVEALHRTFITPFDRNDIHQLISKLDDIMDTIDDIASGILLYRLNTTAREVLPLASILKECLLDIKKMLLGLRGEKSLELMQPIFRHIHQLENEADRIFRQYLCALFEEEKDPINLIKWKESYEQLEQAVDSCETTAHLIEGVMIESS